jgi:hypothetical protein
MKVLERLTMIDRIGRELQKRMTFGEIDAYLKAYGVDTTRATSGVNSKWVHTKERLADEKDSVLIQIADELDIPHSYTVSTDHDIVEATFWEPFRFRLFLSHLSSFKSKAAQLQRCLLAFGISAFVAHVDIEPTKEWLAEIEAGLRSMDALVAILMPGFKESNWTYQEVGVAVGRGVLVIPVMKGITPYGFISKYQGLNADGKTIIDVAKHIFQILATSPKTRTKMLSCLVEATLQAKSISDAIKKVQYLAMLKDVPRVHLERLREGATSSAILLSDEVLPQLDRLLKQGGLMAVVKMKRSQPSGDDDIPF